MIFSLINVCRYTDTEFNPPGTINGNWIQDHVGTLETAIETAKQTEQANGNKIDVAVCESMSCWNSIGEFISFRKRFDIKRN